MSHHIMECRLCPLSVDPNTLTLFSEQTLFRNDSWLSIRTTQTQHDGPCLFLFCNICAVLLCVRVCVCVLPHIFIRTWAAARNPVRAKTEEVQAKADSNTIALIGNSFVYYNCMPSMLQEMLAQNGIFLKQEELLIGLVFSFPQYPIPIPKPYMSIHLRVLERLLIRTFQLCDV